MRPTYNLPRITSQSGSYTDGLLENIDVSWQLDVPGRHEWSFSPVRLDLERPATSSTCTTQRTSGFGPVTDGLMATPVNPLRSLTTSEESSTSEICYVCSIDIPWMFQSRVASRIGFRGGSTLQVMYCLRCGGPISTEKSWSPSGDAWINTT